MASQDSQPQIEVAEEVERLVTTVRDGHEAERRLHELCGSKEFMAELRHRKALHPDPEHDGSHDLVAEVLMRICAEIQDREERHEGRYRDAGAYFDWFKKKVGEEQRFQHGGRRARDRVAKVIGRRLIAEQEHAWREETPASGGSEAKPDAPPPSKSLDVAGRDGTLDSFKILRRPELAHFDRYFVPSNHKSSRYDKYFMILCDVLYRIVVWRYVCRRARNQSASFRDLKVGLDMLVPFVGGFQLDDGEKKTLRDTIEEWVGPAIQKLKKADKRRIVRRVSTEFGLNGSDGDRPSKPGGAGGRG